MFGEKYIEKLKTIPTPYYFYNLDVLEETLKKVSAEAKKYNYKVHYALKANANKKILEKIKAYGLGADCVSGNEVARAVEVGFPQDEIVFAGVGKSDEELRNIISGKIGQKRIDDPENNV